MYQAHYNADCVKSEVESSIKEYEIEGQKQSVPEISCSASLKDHTLTLTLANLSLDNEQEVSLNLLGGVLNGTCNLTVLSSTSEKDGNSFDEPEKVIPKTSQINLDPKDPKITLPKASVVLLSIPVNL